jgi:transposase
LCRTLYGARSERKERLIDQLEMQLEDAEADATEDELAAERASPSTTVKSFERKRPDRKPFPEHLPRERVVVAAPQSCPCCGSTRLSKLGEDATETLEVVPRQWKVIQTVRGRFSCRQCEAIVQPPTPFHVTPRGFAGPGLLAMILFEKFGQHQPLNRQSERYAREGVDLSLLTLADQVGACAAALRPLHALIEAHVLSAERLHGDDTTVPILAKGQTETGRVWVYVRDDRPFDGKDPPAALFYASRDRTREHPERHLSGYAAILQADALDCYNRLYLPATWRESPVLAAGRRSATASACYAGLNHHRKAGRPRRRQTWLPFAPFGNTEAGTSQTGLATVVLNLLSRGPTARGPHAALAAPPQDNRDFRMMKPAAIIVLSRKKKSTSANMNSAMPAISWNRPSIASTPR